MKVSLNTVSELAGIDLPPVDELVERVNAQLGGVEEVIDLAERYKDARIVSVAKAEKHPSADRLSVCMVDDGGIVKDIERDEHGLVQVVCGAPNVSGGMLAIWLPPGSTVPSTYDDKEPFVLAARELRGVVSNGMLAAGDELAINDDHDGIIEITEKDLPVGIEKNDELIGQSFADVFGLNDVVIDIENKMFTHRPDLFGQMGVAREIFAILQPEPFDSDYSETRFPEAQWYWQVPSFESAGGLDLSVSNEAPEVVPRFMAVALSDVAVGPSPLWLQTTLLRWGSKSINNVVDLTNYIMLLTAQPTHAYDYDKLRGNTLSARLSKKGETAKLLNGKTYELVESDIVIADSEGVVGLAGIMGGGESEVSDSTTRVVLEVATFDMYSVRRSAMRHGLFTDALTRFNKGQSPLQNDRVLARLLNLLTEITGAKQASDVFDLPDKSDQLDEVVVHPALNVRPSFVSKRLGLELTGPQISNLLRFAAFSSYPTEDKDADSPLNISAPFWRTDIELPEDIVEEVGRLYDFDRLPRELPQRTSAPAPVDRNRVAKSRVRALLKQFGANEVLSYTFVHEKLLKKAQQSVDKAFRLSNALSPDLQYYRLSIVPSLLDKVHMNIKNGFDEFVLYEFGRAHHADMYDDDKLPREYQRLGLVYSSKKPTEGSAYYVVKRYVDELAAQHALDIDYVPMTDFDFSDHEVFYEAAQPFESSRSAVVIADDLPRGIVGELKQQVARDFKLPASTAAAELILSLFTKVEKGERYHPLSRFPSVSQDVSLRVGQTVPYLALQKRAQNAANGVIIPSRVELSPLSVYVSEQGSSTKTITFRIKITSDERTLTEADASAVVASVVEATAERFSAEQI